MTVPLLVSFLEAHQNAVESFESSAVDVAEHGSLAMRAAPAPPVVEEEAIDASSRAPDLPAGVALIGRYWRGVLRDALEPAVEREVVAAADADPPLAFANHYLGHAALGSGKRDEAAERLLREGDLLSRSGPRRAARARSLGRDDGDVGPHRPRRSRDRRVDAPAQPWLQLRSALRTHDWKRAARAFPRSLAAAVTLGTSLLAAIAALAGGTFCARLGGVSMRAPRCASRSTSLAFAPRRSPASR